MTSSGGGTFEKKVHPMVNVPEAIRIVLRETAHLLLTDEIGTETIPLLQQPPHEGQQPRPDQMDDQWKQLLDRRVAQDVIMPEPGYPAYNASVMDGYAVNSKDVFVPAQKQDDTTWTHVVVGKVFAGDGDACEAVDSSKLTLSPPLANAYYITTGAVLPDNCDCVVPIEECWVSQDEKLLAIKASAKISAGSWIRPVGFDIPAGTVVISKGHIIDPAAVGLLLQTGVNTVDVHESIRVGVLSTGNELHRPGDDASKMIGKIPDVNRPTLLSLLTTFKTCTPVDLGIEGDDNISSLTQTLSDAMNSCHVIVTTGGISTGESDVMEQVLMQQFGATLHIGRFHMKPGKPTTFLTLQHNGRQRLVFALPGNPVSGYVCAQLLVRPCLQLLVNGSTRETGASEESFNQRLYRLVQTAWVHPETTAILSHDVKLDLERPEYHRVTLLQYGATVIATSTGVQQSSRLLSLRDAEGLILLPQGTSLRMEAKKGESFTVLQLKETRGSTVENSRHLNPKAIRSKALHVSLIRVTDSSAIGSTTGSLNRVSDLVKAALTGTKSGAAEVVSLKSFSGDVSGLFDFCVDRGEDDDILSVDLFVLVYHTTFRYHLNMATELRRRLTKTADSLALQAREGAASQNARCAQLEIVVGYVASGRGSMMIVVPESGMEGALGNVRGLLKHALEIARG